MQVVQSISLLYHEPMSVAREIPKAYELMQTSVLSLGAIGNNLPALIFTYVLSSLAVFFLLAKVSRSTRDDAPGLFLFTLGAGPFVVALLLENLLRFLPGQTGSFYVTTIVVTMLLPFVFVKGLRGHLEAVADSLKLADRSLTSQLKWPQALLVVTAGTLFAIICIHCFVVPLTQNDPLEYGVLARMILKKKAVSFYPALDPDPETGYYDVVAHPLAFGCLSAWHLFVQGSSEYNSFVRIISPVFAAWLSVLVFAIGAKRSLMTGLVAVVLLLVTPAFFFTATIGHIDSFRIYAFFNAFAALAWTADKPSRTRLVISGFSFGLALYAHSIGLLAMPLMGMCYLLVSRQPLKDRFLFVTGIALIAVAIGGRQYFQNLQIFGSPINNDFPLFQEIHLDTKGFVRKSRNLATLADRVQTGLLQAFTRSDRFNFVFWFALLGLAAASFRAHRDKWQSTFFLTFIGFFGILTATVIFGIDTLIMNERYVLTLTPFAASLAASGIHAVTTIPWRSMLLGRSPRASASAGWLAIFGCLVYSARNPQISWAIRDIRDFKITPGNVLKTDFQIMKESGHKAYAVMAYVRENVPPDETVLVYRMGELAFYTEHKLIRDSDPRLKEMYLAPTRDETAAELRKLGIWWIETPRVWPPSYLKTLVRSMSEDPLLSERLPISNDVNSLFRLRDPAANSL